jgi:putative MFS transporter
MLTQEQTRTISGSQVAQVIDKTGITSTTKVLVFAAALGYLFDAFDNTMVGYLMPLISKDFVISPVSKGLILSLALWGGTLGMWFWGPISEAKGRRYGFQGTVLSFAFFTGLAALTWSPISFGVTRFIAGAGLAGFYAVDLALVSEMTPTKVRGRCTSFITILYPVGVILAGVVTGFLAQRIGWRAMFLIGITPAICAYLVRRRVPESPRWLASKGRIQEAIASLLRMGAAQQTIDEVQNVAPDTATPAQADLDKGRVTDKFKELFSRRWLSANIVAWSLWICGNYAAWGVTLWLPTILMEVYHFTFVKGAAFLAITYAFGLLGRICGVLLIDKIGRKPLISYAYSVAAIACLAFGTVKTAGLLLCFIAIFKFFEQQGTLAVMGYIPEIYPTRLRVMGNAYAGAASRITSALAPIMVGVLIGMHQYLAIWIIFAAVLVVGVVIVLLLGPETKGKTLEQLTESA